MLRAIMFADILLTRHATRPLHIRPLVDPQRDRESAVLFEMHLEAWFLRRISLQSKIALDDESCMQI